MRNPHKFVSKAFSELYPNKKFCFNVDIKYSARFKGYNARVYYTKDKLEFRLSKQWQGVDEAIIKGLIQELLIKIFGGFKNTLSIQLYNTFMKKAYLGVMPTKIEPELKESFDRVNQKYMFGIMETPNLKWGTKSYTKLGSYDYGTDTITISSILKNHDDLLDYVMYHEMLHKKYKFTTKNGRTLHHSKEFREEEAKFENAKLMEKKIRQLCYRQKIFRFF